MAHIVSLGRAVSNNKQQLVRWCTENIQQMPFSCPNQGLKNRRFFRKWDQSMLKIADFLIGI
jgi:hypothetical protein